MYTVENRLEKTVFWSALIKLLKFGLIVTNILVVITTFAAVVTRALNISLLGYEELLIIFAFWLYMFGSAYGSYEKSHIKADFLVLMMREGLMKDIASLIRQTLSVILGFIFIVWAAQLFYWGFVNGQLTPVWRIPVVVSQSSLLFGLGVGTFFNIVYLYNEIKAFYLKRIKKIDSGDERGE